MKTRRGLGVGILALVLACIACTSPTASMISPPSGLPVMVDSAMTREEALSGSQAPDELLQKMRLVNVSYIGYDGRLHSGQVVVHRNLTKDIRKIFAAMRAAKFQVKAAIPAVQFGWDDAQLLKKNITSCFNYRLIAGTNAPSNHGLGAACDINPFTNPWYEYDSRGKVTLIDPEGAKYDPKKPGTLFTGKQPLPTIIALGWVWGGDGKWTPNAQGTPVEIPGAYSVRDFQHIECWTKVMP